ncbi:hypothetical protein HZH66_001236 [Vespula vulgaris]|uniref:Nucleotide exchange factor Fes1 domain-containing protein n=1 Tax=Vespula vulgaris TaxID=7454 RepID=A0A834NKG5_VESVU|nr:hypothetical protein HZH66_001236 [Vespula vulgaris]
MGASHTRKRNTKMNRPTSNSEKTSGESHPSSSARPLSIEGPRTSNNQIPPQPLPEQPRQPTDLQGLLRFAIEASQAEGVTHEPQFQPLDEEKKKFLTEALSSLTVNVIEELQKAIKILSNVVDLRPDDDSFKYDAALERIADFVDSIDIANDFYKIGGFSIFGPCLNSSHSSIRWRTADIIAELTQNNPFCQQRILECGLFPILLGMVDKDPSEAARIKSLYAISCIVRGQPMSLQYIDKNDGYSVLLRAMQSSVKKLQIKSAFLLSSLCNKDNSDNLKITFVNMGLIEQAAGLLASDNISPEIREQLLSILTGLTNNTFLPALRECRRPELCLKTTLEQCLKELTPENKEEIDMCHQLLDKIFSDNDIVEER